MVKIVFCTAGLGMGNAARVSAIIEELMLNGEELEAHIFSWGRGFSFFEKFAASSALPINLYQLTSYPFAKSLWLQIPLVLYVYFKNCVAIWKTIRIIKPRLVLIDSDYHFPAYVGTTTVFLGQAIDVLSRAHKHNFKTRNLSWFFSFWIREKLDSFIQQLLSTVVLVPSFDLGGSSDGNSVRVPLIVRSSFNLTRAADQTRVTQTPCVLTSGSEQGAAPLRAIAEANGWPLFSPKKQFTKDGFTLSGQPFIEPYEIVITNAGLSSLSECLARGKKMLMFPIPFHAEQELNALEIEALGAGIKWRTKDNLNELLDALQRQPYPRKIPRVDGAKVVAAILRQRFIN